MIKQMLVLALSALVAVPAIAAPTVRTMYADAMAKEEAVRTALAGPTPPEAVLKAVRTAIGSYEALVRRYPNSSYSDNALWQAGRLSLDAFEKFGQAQDREAGVRLLTSLRTEYPSSKLAKQVPERLAAAERRPVQAPARPPAAPPEPPSKRAALPSTPESAASAPVAVSTSAAAARTAAAQPASKEPGDSPTPPKPAVQQSGVTIRQITRTVLPDVVRVVVELSSETPYHDERIQSPDRIFIDFASTDPAPPLVDRTLRFSGDADAVRQVRVGRHPNSTTRVVLDAAGISSYSVFPMYNPYRLVIDCVRATASGLAAAAAIAPAVPLSPAAFPRSVVRPDPPRPALVARRVSAQPSRMPTVRPWNSAFLAEASWTQLASRHLASDWGRRLPRSTPFATTALASARAATAPASDSDLPPVASSQPPAASLPTTPAPATRPAGGFSMARQLGLGVSRIVIDPGHGGHDPGAKGKGLTEAELVLDVALKLEAMLQEVHGVEVILTRRTDDFVPLQERTAIANREGADLFLSIHANASANAQARGIETYFLNFAENLSAASVAARENAASGQPMGALPDFVKAIALNNKIDESRDFASLVQHSMMERLRDPDRPMKNLGVKQAPFVVLIGASMPSVLAEVSFLTNPQEAKLLKSSEYRARIAQALFDAIGKYQTSLTRVQASARE